MTLLKITHVLPRDHFDGCTVNIMDWVKNAPEDNAMALEFLLTTGELRTNKKNGTLRDIVVGYDPNSDQTFCLAKFDNNGNSFILSQYDMNLDEAAY